MNKKTEKNTVERRIQNYKKDVHNMITLAIATGIMAIVSTVVIIVFGLGGINYVLPSCILTVLFGVFFILSLMTVRKTKKLIKNQNQ